MIAITGAGAEEHPLRSGVYAKLESVMNEYGVLTNRRRTLIALAHSLVFLALAVRGFDSPKTALLLHGSSLDLGVGLVILHDGDFDFGLADHDFRMQARTDVFPLLRRRRHAESTAHMFRRCHAAGREFPARADADLRCGNGHVDSALV